MNMCNMEQGTKTSPVAETWRPVKGFEGIYEVSDLARVRSLPYEETRCSTAGKVYTIKHPAKIRKLQMGLNGYYALLLKKDGKYYPASVHRLVAEAFVPNPDNLPEVNHKDECKTNNLPSNLEWCDHAYNQKQGTISERISASKQKRQIEQLTLDGQHVAYFDSAYDAAKVFGSTKANICCVLKGRSKTAYGYLWRFVDEPITTRTFDRIEQLTLDGQHVAYFDSIRDAAKSLGTKYICIYKALTGTNTTAKGYRWRSI